jgi:pimeloyl-ACP methyl ester carboxylesterase
MKGALILLFSCVFFVPMTGIADSEEVTVQRDGFGLRGTLECPETAGAVCVVLIIAGSGPTDRDGNSTLLPGRNDHLKLLAEGLAAEGIASLRYDKRGIGKSTDSALKEEDLMMEDLVCDAVRLAEFLRDDERFSSVTVIGHSEGSLIGMLASQAGPVDGFISIAGAGFPIYDILLRQIAHKLSPTLYEEAVGIVDELLSGRTVQAVDPTLMALFRPSVQPFLISYFAYDPRQEIGKLAMPVLIVQGETDIQTGMSDAEALRASLQAAGRTASVLTVKKMNHVLKEAEKDPRSQMKAYTDPSLPLAEGLVEAITRFIREMEVSSQEGTTNSKEAE